MLLFVRRFPLLCFLLLWPVAAQAPAAPTVTLAREPQPSGNALEVLGQVPSDVQTALIVRDVQTGEVLMAQRADQPLIAASTTKLLTGAAALYDRGGAAGWWSTELTVPATEGGKAAVSSVTLRGTGDPTLNAYDGPNSLRALTEQAHKRGLRRVGQVYLDLRPLNATSFEETVLGLPMPAIRLQDWEERPPASEAEARRRLGQTLINELRRAGVVVENEELADAPAYRPYTPPPRQDDKGRPLPPDLTIPPERRPEQGIASVRSESPFDYVAQTLRPSDNFRAETLLAALGVQPGQRGNLAAALAHEREILERMGLDLSSVELEDGSGLGRGNRIPPRVLSDLLKVMYDLPYSSSEQAALPDKTYAARHNVFVESLPQAGTNENTPNYGGRGGTLAHRMVGRDLDVRAKTGTLPGVSALAGYVTAKSGRMLAFAILMNGPETSPILTLRQIQDEWVEAVADAF